MATATATVVDTTGQYGSTAVLQKDLVAAFDAWSAYLAPSAGTIDIELRLVNSGVDRGDGGAGTAIPIGSAGGYTIADSGAAYELRTGMDPNGATPDIVINLNTSFAAQWYWPNPLDGSAVPANKSDLVSVFAHEIGHGLGINGYRDWSTYTLSGSYETPFDTEVKVTGGAPYFTGANASALYGGAVPLTAGDLYHLGNSGGAGGQLGSDLMNGWVMPFGTTPVSSLDAAVLSDVGVPTNFNDSLDGAASADTMFGGGGDDFMRGMDGNDSIDGGSGNDDVNGNVGQDVVHGGDGNDSVRGGQGDDTVYGDAGDDPHVNGNKGDDLVDGGAGNDTVYGGQGNDTVYGGEGDDLVSGDLGNDILYGGPGADRFVFHRGFGVDWVEDFHASEGDRVQLAPGTAYTVVSVQGQAVVDLGGGDQLGLAGVPAASFQTDWIVYG